MKLGNRITDLANEQIGFKHPEIKEWQHMSFCQFTLPIYRDKNNRIIGKNTVVVKPGKLDRSPTGTGCSARMAILAEQPVPVGDRSSLPGFTTTVFFPIIRLFLSL